MCIIQRPPYLPKSTLKFSTVDKKRDSYVEIDARSINPCYEGVFQSLVVKDIFGQYAVAVACDGFLNRPPHTSAIANIVGQICTEMSHADFKDISNPFLKALLEVSDYGIRHRYGRCEEQYYTPYHDKFVRIEHANLETIYRRMTK